VPNKTQPPLDRFGRTLVIDGTFPKGRPRCLSVFESALETRDAQSFFAAFSTEKLWGGPWAEHLAQMSEGLRMLRLGDLLFFSVSYPAGLVEEQAFAEYAVELKDWLDEHGAAQSAQYVGELLGIFPRGRPIADAELRADFLSKFEADQPDRLDEIGGRYSDVGIDRVSPLRTLLEKRGGKLAQECERLRGKFAEAMPLALGEIVQISDDQAFSRALVKWLDAPTGHPALGFDRQPELGRMLWVLEALATSVGVDGMTHFLNSAGVGAFFGKLEGWAKTIGASTTREYVRAATAHLKQLNGGKLPPMKDPARQAAIERLESRDRDAGGRGLLEALDSEFGQLVTAELPKKMRDYVRRNRAEIEQVVLDNAAKHRKP
jgi:hypothetical protein